MVSLVSVVRLVWVCLGAKARQIWVVFGKIQTGEGQAGQGGKLAGGILVEAVELVGIKEARVGTVGVEGVSGQRWYRWKSGKSGVGGERRLEKGGARGGREVILDLLCSLLFYFILFFLIGKDINLLIENVIVCIKHAHCDIKLIQYHEKEIKRK